MPTVNGCRSNRSTSSPRANEPNFLNVERVRVGRKNRTGDSRLIYVTVAELNPLQGCVRFEGDELLLEGFVERDSEVIAFVRDSDDGELAVHRCLEMGARVLRLAGATLDTQLVEHRFAELTVSLERSVDALASRVDDSARELLDEENGELSGALTAWLVNVQELLGATFDETSKRSAIAKLENVLEKARADQVSSVRRLLDPDNDESPLARWRTEIVREVRERGVAIETALDEVRSKLDLDDQRSDLMALTAVKGFDYEDVVFDTVQKIVTPLQDVPAHVGNEAGSAGAKVGDIVVDLDPTLVPGRRPRYVVECKDRAMSLKKALDELDAAIVNRDADAGIMVFASVDSCPSEEMFQWFDRRAIVVFDKESLDPHALRLACLWARWLVSREATDGPETIDAPRVAALIDEARRSLRTASAIRGSHTRARKAVDEAGRQLDTLVGEIDPTLDELATCVAVESE
jgi:hypothetical protein